MIGICFKIPKVHSSCCSCKRPFIPEQQVRSSLEEGENKEKRRRDFCLLCSPCKDSTALFWQRFYPQAQEKDPLVERSIALFLDLVEKEEEKSRQLAYTLFQLLKRQKKAFLISKEAISEARETVVLEIDGHVVALTGVPKEEEVSRWLSQGVFDELKQLLELV